MSNLRCFWRPATALLTLNLLTLAALWLFQTLASAYETQIYPPPGRLIEVGDYRLHLNCTGERATGEPLVILEGGLGAPALLWAVTQAAIAEHYRVCSYDRAGYGWSDPGPAPRTAAQLTAELHTLLQNAGEAPPYVLVGHSLGSLLVRVYAATYPAEVTGLVLLDPRHEDFFARMPPASLQADERNRRNAEWLRVLTPLGYTRLLGALGRLPEFEHYLAPLPAEVQATAWARMIYRPGHWDTAVAERAASEITYAQARAAVLSADLPLIVLTAADGWQAWRVGDEAQDEAGRTIWLALQEEQAQLTARGEWRMVEGSGHYLYFDQPVPIVVAIDDVVGLAK